MLIVSVLLNPAIDRVIEVPGLRLGEHLQGRLRARYPAGKAMNVSRALAVLGSPSVATGFLGEGEVEFYQHYAVEHHGGLLECRFVAVRGQTRENITLIDSKANLETHIRHTGFTVTSQDLGRLRELLGSLATQTSVICFCGSRPPGINEETFLCLIDNCLAAEAKVVVDSSGTHMREVAKRSIWVMKPNVKELEEISGYRLENETDIYEAARNLNQHIQIVLVSAGRSGAYLITREGFWRGRLDLPQTSILNTVGCGDCLLGGFLSGVMAGLDFPESFRRGLAAAAANAQSESVAGFQPCDFRRLFEQARVVPRIEPS